MAEGKHAGKSGEDGQAADSGNIDGNHRKDT